MAIVSFGYILPAARGLHWKTIQAIQVYEHPTGTQICNLAEYDQNKILFARLWQRPAWHGCIHGMKRVQVLCEKPYVNPKSSIVLTSILIQFDFRISDPKRLRKCFGWIHAEPA